MSIPSRAGSISRNGQRWVVIGALALVVATVIASFHYGHRKAWLNGVTLEVQGSSAPTMMMSSPSRAVLLLKAAGGKETHMEIAQWASNVSRPFTSYRFDLPLLDYAEAIFFPDPSLNRIEIRRVRIISHGGEEPVEVPLARVRTRSNLGEAGRTSDSVTFWRTQGEGAAAVELQISDFLRGLPSPPKPSLMASLLVFLGVFGIAFALVGFVIGEASSLSFQPENGSQLPLVRFGVIAGLVLCMAAGAHPNSHPDEYLHVESARYYLEHWVPPSLTSIWISPSYSHYGMTYLSSPDAGYLFAAKAVLFLKAVLPDIFTAFRFFNASLLVILFFWSARVFRQSYGPWVLLLTPQVWYLFSAYNNDAWALFVSFLLVGQITSTESSLRKYLVSPPSPSVIIAGIPPTLLGCLALLSKSNYLVVYVFFVLWLLYFTLGIQTRKDARRVVLRILPLLLIPLVLRFSVYAYQQSVNEGNLKQAILQKADQLADPGFSPSGLKTGKGGALLNAREKGISARDLLIRYRWAKITVASFFGVYGWMTYPSSPSYYWVIIAGWVGLMGWVFAATLSRRPLRERFFHLVAWLHLPLLVALCFYHSWTSDFQAQGRYLFPFLPILFYLFHSVKPSPRPFLAANVWAVFLVSAYGFLVFGLRPLCN